MLYELLTGRPPFQGDSPVAIAYQHVREEAPPPSRLDPSIPQWADAIVMKALVKDPNYRYQSAAEMRADIQRALQGMPVAAPTMAMNGGTRLMGAGPPTQATRPATMGYDLPPVEYAEPDRPEGRGKKALLWTLVGVLAVGAVVALYFIFSGGNPTGNATKLAIPAGIVGSDEDTAKTKLEGVGILPDNIHVKHQTSDQVDKGNVISVNPPENTALDKAKLATTQVNLVVSSGKPKVKVPSVHGRSQDEAESILKNAGLQTGPIERKASSTVPKGYAIGTSPNAGSRVEKGTEVTLYISDGPGSAIVPNEIGKQVDDAKADLQNSGFKVRVNLVDGQPGQQPGQVVDQNPKDGDTANKGSTVTLVVVRQQQAPPTQPGPTASFPGFPGPND